MPHVRSDSSLDRHDGRRKGGEERTYPRIAQRSCITQLQLQSTPSSGRSGDLAYDTHYLSCCDPKQLELSARLPNDRANYIVQLRLIPTHVLYDPQKSEVVMYKVVKFATTRTCHAQSGLNYNSCVVSAEGRTMQLGTDRSNCNRFRRRAWRSTSPFCLTDLTIV